jgi:plasmid stabilization system protein ParE
VRVRLSPFVAGDLEEIGDYIAKDSPRHASRLLKMIGSRIHEIAIQPELYRLRPEIGPEARLAVLGQYVILFRIRANAVRIERIVHGSRDLVQILERAEI